MERARRDAVVEFGFLLPPLSAVFTPFPVLRYRHAMAFCHLYLMLSTVLPAFTSSRHGPPGHVVGVPMGLLNSHGGLMASHCFSRKGWFTELLLAEIMLRNST